MRLAMVLLPTGDMPADTYCVRERRALDQGPGIGGTRDTPLSCPPQSRGVAENEERWFFDEVSANLSVQVIRIRGTINLRLTNQNLRLCCC